MTSSSIAILVIDTLNPEYPTSLFEEWQSKWSNSSLNVKFVHLQLQDTLRFLGEEEKPARYEKLRKAEKEHGPVVGIRESLQ